MVCSSGGWTDGMRVGDGSGIRCPFKRIRRQLWDKTPGKVRPEMTAAVPNTAAKGMGGELCTADDPDGAPAPALAHPRCGTDGISPRTPGPGTMRAACARRVWH